ncbi:MAG: hypothetical protein JWQ42_1125 [Edaphobacter sp.]|nr:hypothetical protein [Edaphobacter sp.]
MLLYAFDPTSGDNGEWTNSFVQFQFFCAGTLIALLLRGRLVRLPVPMRVVGSLLGFGCWFTALLCFKVQSWEPHPTPVGAVLGWFLGSGRAINFLPLCSWNSLTIHLPNGFRIWGESPTLSCSFAGLLSHFCEGGPTCAFFRALCFLQPFAITFGL